MWQIKHLNKALNDLNNIRKENGKKAEEHGTTAGIEIILT